MSLVRLPGHTGFVYGRYSSMDRRAVGKLTDSNHLESFHTTDPFDYDKKVISLYTQSSLYSNDFLNMISGAEPFYIGGNSDAWKWKVQVPYRYPKIIQIPDATAAMTKPGIAGKEFDLVLDTAEFTVNAILAVGSRMYGPNIVVLKDPQPWDSGFLVSFGLLSENPNVDFVSPDFLKVGTELELINGTIGEFDQDLLGLPRLGEEIIMFETLGSGFGFEHTITSWADDKMLRDGKGRPLDILVFGKQQRNEIPDTKQAVRWEPFIEFWMRKQMLEMKVKRYIWSKPGTTKTKGGKQELKRTSAGIHHRMRTNGNLVQYNRGEFTPNLLRSIFGDLFYRRVSVKDRRVKLYTNEAGFDVFQQAVKQDAINSGLTLVADSGDRYIQGKGQNLTYNWAFDSMITRETGKVDLIHLQELDLPQTNVDFGQNKKSAPIFMVFDVSPSGNGSLASNVREVRREGMPSMTWGYVDGRRHHLGAMKSQGHSAANKFPGYTLWMEDRCDVFIEDLSRTVLIEEVPQY